MYDQVASNKRRSWVLLVVFVLIVVGVGTAFNYVFGFGPVGILLALMFAGGMSFFLIGIRIRLP